MTTRASVDGDALRPPPLAPGTWDGPLTAPSHGASGTRASRSGTDASTRNQVVNAGKSRYQRFVLNDPVAFRYLEEDASTSVLERRQELPGYECYIVEQWTTSRTHPTFVITTYTGDPSHVVTVGVINVPTDESAWSPRLRVYFRALNQYHAQRRETPLGIMMVTNLSNFPSSLTIVAIPDGDPSKHRFNFFVNENLKRLGCLGRMGLTLGSPAPATVAKFHQLYRTSDKNEAYKAVVELIKLCQSALMLFDKLEVDYSDGLLCDVTERAINDWWLDIGTQQYNIEPHDGILGPTTVAGLLGLLMGARNRLNSVNAPVPKDPFDVDGMKRGISAFQKQQRIERTRRLDRRTLHRLHAATQKAAEKERWAVPKAVKSTMAELSGKGGDLLDVVGRRDRAGIAEIETVDIDHFVQLVFGDRSKWLWFGRPMKKAKAGDSSERSPEEVQGDPSLNKGLLFRPDDQGGFAWTLGRKSTADSLLPTPRDKERDQEYHEFVAPTKDDGANDSDDNHARPAAIKRATRSGLGMVKGAVSFRNHRPKASTDEPTPMSPVEEVPTGRQRQSVLRAQTSPTSPSSGHASPEYPGFGEAEESSAAVQGQSNRLNAALKRGQSEYQETRSVNAQSTTSKIVPTDVSKDKINETSGNSFEDKQQQYDTNPATVTAESSIADSTYHGLGLDEALPTSPETGADVSVLLKRTLSFSQYVETHVQQRSDEHFPRHLSFSLAESSVLQWKPVVDTDDHASRTPAVSRLRVQLEDQEHLAREAKYLRSIISSLQAEVVTWTLKQMRELEAHLPQADRDQEKLDSLYYPRLQEVQALQSHASGMLKQEKSQLGEGGKEIETLAARLEYEINALRGKVEDVEAGVVEFEKGVGRVEERVAELEKDAEKGSGWSCVIQ